jgi:LmbE family N-acetylglucosaminyl deacetylase
MLKKVLLVALSFKFLISFAQVPKKLDSNEIYRKIEALNFLGTAMYIAAHPDDENTRLISYLSNQYHAQTYYLSLTRGDGGQNLLGSDLKEALGIIRTQELLKARRTDGGNQRFTRAIDFGYSKSPEETLNIWNKDSILHDLVWQIRQLKPDVIINRFDHRTPGTTHGHHTTSAMLSVEAFDLVSDEEAFPEDLQTTSIWQPKRLFFNTSWWFYGSRENFEKADKSRLLNMDIGTYYSDLGLSNTEIASLSRTQHKSQAFGNTPRRGEQIEYIELIKGKMPENNDLFEGIDTSWTRVDGGAEIKAIIDEILENFNHREPYKSVPKLVEAFKQIQQLENKFWRELKSQQIKDIIKSSLGLYLESVAQLPYQNLKSDIELEIEVINRSPIEVQLKTITIPNGENIISENIKIKNNQAEYFKTIVKTPNEYTNPYWLNNPPKKGLYSVSDKSLIGLPETPRPLKLELAFDILGIDISFNSEVIYKYNDRVDGEVHQNFEILPKVSLSLDDVFIFKNSKTKNIEVKVKSFTEDFKGELSLNLPKNWQFTPSNYSVNLKGKGNEKSYAFSVTPPNITETVVVEPNISADGILYNREIKQLDYEHIPLQTYLKPTKSNLVNININSTAKNIGYIKGAGDKIPENLESLGLSVSYIDIENIMNANELSEFDAVILGIRAFNTQEALATKNSILFNYVKNGGTLISQYNTTYSLLTEDVSPINLKISRDRVTDETATVKFLNQNHKVLNFPNKITANDFEDWIQERGLYFPNQWDDKFEPIFSIKDYGNGPYNGSLLVAQYGEGYYIYTGLSFFRQLPAGVPGAFRLLANMLSINDDE